MTAEATETTTVIQLPADADGPRRLVCYEPAGGQSQERRIPGIGWTLADHEEWPDADRIADERHTARLAARCAADLDTPTDPYRIPDPGHASDIHDLDYDYPPEPQPCAAAAPGRDTAAAALARYDYWTREAALTWDYADRRRCLSYAARAAATAGILRGREDAERTRRESERAERRALRRLAEEYDAAHRAE